MRERWRVYYDSGAYFSWEDGAPENVPGYGVVAIAQEGDPDDMHAPKREIQHKWDWYFWEPERGEWWGCDWSGLVDRLLHRLPTSAVCQGRSVPNVLYRTIMQKAAEDDL